MTFKLQPKQQQQSEGIDYEAIAAQIDEGTAIGVVSLIVDLGTQVGGYGFSLEETTEVDTEEEAEAIIDQIKEIGGKGSDSVDYEEDDGKYIVNASVYKKKDAQEVCVFVDFPDYMVTYKEGEPALPYRVSLNPNFMGELKGFRLVASPPKKGSKLWTFAPNSVLYKLAEATKHKEVISEGEDNMNIGNLLGESLLVQLVKKGSFISAKSLAPLMKGQKADDLPFEPVGISFETVTVEELRAAKLRKAVIDKIKQAKNYTGSRMEKAIIELESSTGSSKTSDNSDVKGKGGTTVASKGKTSSTRKPEQNTYSADDLNEDLPF